jgi:hypothetical protein
LIISWGETTIKTGTITEHCPYLQSFLEQAELTNSPTHWGEPPIYPSTTFSPLRDSDRIAYALFQVLELSLQRFLLANFGEVHGQKVGH